jgi:hypothetical protein
MSNTEIPFEHTPGFPVVLSRPALLLELVAWFHRVQWAHRQALPTMRRYETLSQYATRTDTLEHINLFLFGIPLETRVLEFRRLMRQFKVSN